MSVLARKSERELPGLTCNACNKKFMDESEQRIHYKSEWHRYNLKRKVAGVPGVTEALFLARQSALAEEKNKSNEAPTVYSCVLCGKEYRSLKAHTQHLNSKSHLLRASQGTSNQEVAKAIIKPLQSRAKVKSSQENEAEAEESEESEWEEVDPEEDLIDEAADSLTQMKMNDHMPVEGDSDDDGFDALVPTTCFMCDLEHDTIESCMVHMHKRHGFFIPDIEFLKDPEGLLTYLGLKVKRDYICLYCNERCQPFSSLEAVRKHMEAKSHCKVRYGDGSEEEEAELEEFYDYSSSYEDVGGGQIIEADVIKSVELGSGGSELIITRKSEEGVSTRILGSREFLRYYRQKPRPTPANYNAIIAALASRYRSMGLATVQSREHMVRLKVLRTMNRSGVEAMRTKIGMKNNVIRNLPKNVPY